MLLLRHVGKGTQKKPPSVSVSTSIYLNQHHCADQELWQFPLLTE